MSVQRTDREIREIYERQVDTVWRVCYAYLKNDADTEDAVQETFFRLIRSGPVLQSPDHERAWLIRTAGNVCKNVLKHWWRKGESLEAHEELAAAEPEDRSDVLEAVLALPDRYKAAVVLYYFEGRSGREIAEILHRPHSTVRNHLREARELLRERLGDDFDE